MSNMNQINFIFIFLMGGLLGAGLGFGAPVSIYCPSDVPAIQFAAKDLQQALEKRGSRCELLPVTKLTEKPEQTQFVLGLASDALLLKRLQAAGGKAPGTLMSEGDASDGENLLAALQGSALPRTRPVFWEWLGTKTNPDYWPRLAVREGDWKLVLTDDAKRVELHRLTDDRAEAADVAKDHPEIVARLTKLALNWKATLPDKPNPDCLTEAIAPGNTSP